jgi:hypothetical protein
MTQGARKELALHGCTQHYTTTKTPASALPRLKEGLILFTIWLLGFASSSYLTKKSLIENPASAPSVIVSNAAGFECRPPVLGLLSDPIIAERVRTGLSRNISAVLEPFLSSRAEETDIDSLSFAVTGPYDSLFEFTYGSLRANETDHSKRGTVTRDSIYRIASISKMFAVLHTLVLRERGWLDWDDPIDRYIENMSYPDFRYGWAQHLSLPSVSHHTRSTADRITIRQLTSHMAGLGRDFPPVSQSTWPPSSWPPSGESNPGPEQTREEILKAVAMYPLANAPYNYPVYSNTGFSLLGMVNVGATRRAEVDSARKLDQVKEQTYKELVTKDVLDPLGLNTSFFDFPYDNANLANLVAVPNKNHRWVVWICFALITEHTYLTQAGRTFTEVMSMTLPVVSIPRSVTSSSLHNLSWHRRRMAVSYPKISFVSGYDPSMFGPTRARRLEHLGKSISSVRVIGCECIPRAVHIQDIIRSLL